MKQDLLGRGTRRSCREDPSDLNRVIKQITADREISRNINEWFIWNMVRVTQLEYFFAEIFECRDGGRCVRQQRVDCANGRWQPEIDSIVDQIPERYRAGWVDKKGRPHYHTWGRNLCTEQLQIYDYESMQRQSLGSLIQSGIVIPPLFLRLDPDLGAKYPKKRQAILD